MNLIPKKAKVLNYHLLLRLAISPNKLNLYKTDYSGFKFRRLTGISRGAGPVMEWDDTDLETKED